MPGGKRLFFVEAKKTNIDIKNNISVAYQIRRYGWSVKLSVSIITDFEEFAVYDYTKNRFMPVTFINTTESDFFKKNKNLYRFTQVDRFLKILHSGKIDFIRPEKWDDPYEKFFLLAEYINNIDNTIFHWPLKNRVFSICLTNIYSEAFWKGDASYYDGIRIKFDRQNFIRELKNCKYQFYIGSVEYKLTEDIKELKKNNRFINQQLFENNIAENIKLLFQKRIPFAYEQEVRIIMVLENESDEIVQSVNLNLTNIFQEFLLHPKMKKEKANKVISELVEKGFECKQSGLNTYIPVKIPFSKMK